MGGVSGLLHQLGYQGGVRRSEGYRTTTRRHLTTTIPRIAHTRAAKAVRCFGVRLFSVFVFLSLSLLLLQSASALDALYTYFTHEQTMGRRTRRRTGPTETGVGARRFLQEVHAEDLASTALGIRSAECGRIEFRCAKLPAALRSLKLRCEVPSVSLLAWPKMGTRRSQDGPKTAPRWPEMAPRRPKIAEDSSRSLKMG